MSLHKVSEIAKVIDSNKLEGVRTRLSDDDYIGKMVSDKARFLVKKEAETSYSIVNQLDAKYPANTKVLVFMEIELPIEDNRKEEISIPRVALDWNKGTYFKFTVNNGWSNFDSKHLTKDEAKALIEAKTAVEID